MGAGEPPPPPPYSPDVGVPLTTPVAQPYRREISLPDVLSNGAYGRSITRQERESYLKTTQLPAGIQEELLSSCEQFPLRIWIIDNSGSMNTGDGKRVVRAGASESLVGCTRWEELGDTLKWHASVAAHLAAPTEFRLLNPAGGSGLQVLQCGVGPEPTSEIRAVERMLYAGPHSMTPLCAQIKEVVERVKQEETSLRAKGQRCVVVIASDGQASDGDVEVALRPLRLLPVWLIVRLCTDEDAVVEYWNTVDEELELEMDVLDDLAGEAAEVAEKNAWLTYGAPLHRLREWGSTRKVTDFLDEKTLSASELVDFVGLILGKGALAGLPHPSAEWPKFKERITQLMAQVPPVWDPLRKRRRPWFSVKKLQKTYKKDGGCAVM